MPGCCFGMMVVHVVRVGLNWTFRAELHERSLGGSGVELRVGTRGLPSSYVGSWEC